MPYREEKPLAEIIPPDRRRAKMAALVGIGMLAGAGLLYGLQEAAKDVPTVLSTAQPQPPAPPPRPFEGATLEGPDGTFNIPARNRKTIVHVWLQACADCMPAFEAMKDVGDLGAYEINVAYGTADPEWAARYGVRKNLVFDRGGEKVVKPLGISSFTTLVFDESGKLVARDRPDRPGYAARIRAFVNPAPFGASDVESVVTTKRREIRERCWNTHPAVKEADVTVNAVIGGDGTVVSSSATGSDKEVSSCIENEVKSWRFRATGGASVQIAVPFKLRRDE